MTLEETYDDPTEACTEYFSGDELQECKKEVSNGRSFARVSARFDARYTASTSETGENVLNSQELYDDLNNLEPSGDPFVYSVEWVTPDGEAHWQES